MIYENGDRMIYYFFYYYIIGVQSIVWNLLCFQKIFFELINYILIILKDFWKVMFYSNEIFGYLLCNNFFLFLEQMILIYCYLESLV